MKSETPEEMQEEQSEEEQVEQSEEEQAEPEEGELEEDLEFEQTQPEFSEFYPSSHMRAPVLESIPAETPQPLEQQMQEIPSTKTEEGKEFTYTQTPDYESPAYEQNLYETMREEGAITRMDREMAAAPVLPTHIHERQDFQEFDQTLNLRQWQQQQLRQEVRAPEKEYELAGKIEKEKQRRRGFER